VGHRDGHELEDRDALFYPYIHFRDVDWLKRTLLVMPHVVRMVPEKFVPRDDPFVRRLCSTKTRRGPLVRSAELSTDNVALAQRKLKAKLRTDLERGGETFRRQYGRIAANALKQVGDAGFQMHPAKTSADLMHFLESNELAWEPEHPDDAAYRELHPRIGQAILSTVAVACAQDEGLDIVTDPSDKDSRMLDYHLATQGPDHVYEAWVHPGTREPSEKKVNGSALLEFMVYQRCDPSKLTPETLAQLSDDREAVARLRRRLRDMAVSIPTMKNEAKLRERLQEQAQNALDGWREDRMNMSTISKQIFGIETVEGTANVAEKVVEKINSHAVAGGVTAALAASLLGVAPGVAIGVVTHVITSVMKVRRRHEMSPFRYLTMLEKAGVVFTVGT
jgi:hypothetical protein